MENQLKHLYGRRITPGVKILILIVIIFFGLHLVFSEGSHRDIQRTPADTLSTSSLTIIPPAAKADSTW